MQKPDFNRLLKVLKREPTESPVLFEFIIDSTHIKELCGDAWLEETDKITACRNLITGFQRGGYDYTVIGPWVIDLFSFPGGLTDEDTKAASSGQAHCGVFNDEEGFLAYEWPDPDACPYQILEEAATYLPDGMKLIIPGPGGVLENITSLVGYEDLCMMLFDEPELVTRIVDAIGSRMYRYYENILKIDAVGAVFVNDDWGFKTQTMISHDDLRTYIMPWHKKFVDLIHEQGRPALLHSCGNLAPIMDDIINIGYDGKHSYEDTITPVEEAYHLWGDRIAILGGLDVNYLCTTENKDITHRAQNILEQTKEGGYALGSGNSVTYYIPKDKYQAMTCAVR